MSSSDVVSLFGESSPEDSAAADSDTMGILVDAIGDILPPGSPVLPAPPEALSGLDSRFIEGVISDSGQLVTVLRIGALISLHEARATLTA